MFWFMSMCWDTAQGKVVHKVVKGPPFQFQTHLGHFCHRAPPNTSQNRRGLVFWFMSMCWDTAQAKVVHKVVKGPPFQFQTRLGHFCCGLLCLKTYQNWRGLVLLLVSVCCDTAQTKAELQVVKALLFSSKPTLVIFATGHLQTQVRTGEAWCCCLCQCVVIQPKPRQNLR